MALSQAQARVRQWQDQEPWGHGPHGVAGPRGDELLVSHDRATEDSDAGDFHREGEEAWECGEEQEESVEPNSMWASSALPHAAVVGIVQRLPLSTRVALRMTCRFWLTRASHPDCWARLFAADWAASRVLFALLSPDPAPGTPAPSPGQGGAGRPLAPAWAERAEAKQENAAPRAAPASPASPASGRSRSTRPVGDVALKKVLEIETSAAAVEAAAAEAQAWGPAPGPRPGPPLEPGAAGQAPGLGPLPTSPPFSPVTPSPGASDRSTHSFRRGPPRPSTAEAHALTRGRMAQLCVAFCSFPGLASVALNSCVSLRVLHLRHFLGDPNAAILALAGKCHRLQELQLDTCLRHLLLLPGAGRPARGAKATLAPPSALGDPSLPSLSPSLSAGSALGAIAESRGGQEGPPERVGALRSASINALIKGCPALRTLALGTVEDPASLGTPPVDYPLLTPAPLGDNASAPSLRSTCSCYQHCVAEVHAPPPARGEGGGAGEGPLGCWLEPGQVEALLSGMGERLVALHAHVRGGGRTAAELEGRAADTNVMRRLLQAAANCCPSLEVLNLQCSFKAADEDVSRLLLCCPALAHLSLCGERMHPQVALALGRLKSLALSSSYLSNTALKELQEDQQRAQQQQQQDALHKRWLHHYTSAAKDLTQGPIVAPPPAPSELLDASQDWHSISASILSQGQGQAPWAWSAGTAAGAWAGVRALHLDGFQRGGDACLPTLTAAAGPQLRVLRLRRVAGLTDVALERTLSPCTALTALDISFCSALSPRALEAVSRTCGKTLKQLWCRRLPEDAAKAGVFSFPSLSSLLRSCPLLSDLSLDIPRVPAPAWQRRGPPEPPGGGGEAPSTLVSDSVAHSTPGQQRQAWSALPSFHALSCLGPGLQRLCLWGDPSVDFVDMSCSLGVLAASCPRLELLSLQNAECTADWAVEALAEGCPRLRHLALDGTNLTHRAVETAAWALPQLQVLDLRGAHGVTSEDFRVFQSIIPGKEVIFC